MMNKFFFELNYNKFVQFKCFINEFLFENIPAATAILHCSVWV